MLINNQPLAISRSAVPLMHPDLQHLIQLQDLDLAADRARRRISELPAAQQALEARVAEKSAALAAVKERVSTGQTARRDVEKELAAVQSRLSKYKDQLMEVKTNKEYQAMQKEIAVAEHEVRADEDRLLEHMEQAETFAIDVKAAESALKTEQADVAREQKLLDAEGGALDEEIAKLKAARGELVAAFSFASSCSSTPRSASSSFCSRATSACSALSALSAAFNSAANVSACSMCSRSVSSWARTSCSATAISFCIAWYSLLVLTSISCPLYFDSRPWTAASSFSTSRRAAGRRRCAP